MEFPSVTLNTEEYQYLNIIEKILNDGTWEEGRNGRTKSIFGEMMRFSLTNGKIPILTTKKTAWKTCLRELLWFIRGETDNKILQDQGVHIWDGNTTREFLDSRGLHHYREGLIGPGYGFQWRHFNAEYDTNTGLSMSDSGTQSISDSGTQSVSVSDSGTQSDSGTRNTGIDQLGQIINALKDPSQRTSRRLIMTAWNPLQLDQMALPPCHIFCQFNVTGGNKLSCSMYQRSCDELLGVPFNIASYSFLTHLLAHHCGLEAHEFVYFKGNCHLYEDHIEAAKTQLNRIPFPFPTLRIANKHTDIDDYVVDDFVVEGYRSHDAIKAKMIA
jgi:thymidylate synthase